MAGQGKKAEVKVCVFPPWRIASVICKGCKQANGNAKPGARPVPEALGGLWVVFRPKPSAPESKGDYKTLCESFLLKDLWSLGLTSEQGYLGPPVFDRKKWNSLLTGKEKARCEAMWANVLPDAYRFTPGQEYEFYFVQHPSQEVAEKLKTDLNVQLKNAHEGGSAPASAAVPVAPTDYGAPIVLTPDPNGVIELEESPQTFWPSRSWKSAEDKLYGWCLFNGMPSANCAPVKEQVIRLEAHLGALRYPLGDHLWPYAFHVPSPGDGEFNKCSDNDGIFDVRVMNAVYMFQKHARTLRPFQVEAKPHETLVDYQKNYASKITRARREAKGEEIESEAATFAYLRGSYLPKPFSPAPAGAPDGVVEASTARTIKAWLDNRLRKPGEILVRFKTIWMRPSLAKSLYAWNHLARALGSPDGVEWGHAFRQIFHNLDNGLGPGAAVQSPHKTGLAVDMGGNAWMRLYEPNPKRPVLDKERFFWTILGFSDVPCPPLDATEWREQLRGRVKEYALEGEDELVDFGDKMRARLLRLFEDGLSGSPTSRATIDTFFRSTARPWLFDELREDGGGTVKEPWVPQQCFDDAGRFKMWRWFDLEQVVRKLEQLDRAIDLLKHQPKPDQGRIQALEAEKVKQADAAAKIKAEIGKLQDSSRDAQYKRMDSDKKGVVAQQQSIRSFLDLTHVAEVVGLHPIRWAPGMESAYRTYSELNLPALAKDINAAVQKFRGASQRPVIIARDGLKREFEPATIDVEFAKEWPGLLAKVASVLGPKAKLDPPRFTFEVTADTPRAKEKAENLAAILKSDRFAKRCFYAPPPYSGERAVRTGEEWATYITAELTSKIEAFVKANVARFAGYGVPLSVAARLAEQPLAAPPDTRAVPNVQPPAVERWTLCLQPVFVRQYTPTDPAIPNEYPFFPGDTVHVPAAGVSRCQEWWHFQRNDLLRRGCEWELKTLPKLPNEETEETAKLDGVLRDGTWRSLMEIIGWSRECLSTAPSEDLYGRRGVGYKGL